MANKRKSRNKIDKDKVDFLKPLSLTDFGTDKDPCFGKLHDLQAKECKRCGDSDICAIVYSQNLHFKVREIEEKVDFKDVDEIFNDKSKRKKLKIFVKKKFKKGLSKEKVIAITMKKYSLPEKKLKPFIEKIHKNL